MLTSFNTSKQYGLEIIDWYYRFFSSLETKEANTFVDGRASHEIGTIDRAVNIDQESFCQEITDLKWELRKCDNRWLGWGQEPMRLMKQY